MYLSKISFQLNDRGIQAALADCQKMHQLVTGFFGTDRKSSNILYRVRMDRGQHAIYLYSDLPIDETRISARMTLDGQKDISAWLDGMQEGMTKHFDLLVLPTKKVPSERGKNSQRRVLKTPQDRLAWMQRKAKQFGFQLLAVNELEHIRQAGKHSPESSGRMYFDGYHYQGILQVTDAVKFQDALRHGIGAGKAYGFGMLLLS
ncbi:MAG: type I-E CRISPR-associated protein Cas6/Cse3/CasE [Eubacteriales bacterium]|nr:type I-E CRISPR-associated protein Cas6/Cse3/CasE [Eubacteriales bacterium]